MAVFLAPLPARAQMIPVFDSRVTSVEAHAFGLTDSKTTFPSAPFAFFQTFDTAYVENPDPEVGGHCGATAFQTSQFYPAGINISGTTSGGRWTTTVGDYIAQSYADFRFRVDTCIEYQLDAWFLPGDLGMGRIEVADHGTGLAYQTGEVHTTGRLPAGTYDIYGDSYITSSLEHVEGPTYSIIWTCHPCITTLIWAPPQDQTVACGGTAVFTVQPTSPNGPLTYQWRRNLVPLTDNGHIAGATTQTLTINNACDADLGYYDVVLSDGSIIEPSQLARLSVNTTISGVEAPPEGPRSAFSIKVAGPNPFSGRMSFRYNAAMPQRATIAIYNAAGVKIRTLAQGMVSGSGTVTWDGDLESGVRAPAGIYFLRVEAGSIRESKKIVLVR
jgi:hypothetical protein